MLGKHRTAYDYLAEIMRACSEPIGITALCYKTKSHYSVVSKWLKLATNHRLIDCQEKKHQTTVKGHRFLQKWDELQTFLKEEVKNEHLSGIRG